MKKFLFLFPILSFIFMVNVNATTLDYDFRSYYALIKNDNLLLNNVVENFESEYINRNNVYCFVELLDSSKNPSLSYTYINFYCLRLDDNNNILLNDGNLSSSNYIVYDKFNYFSNGSFNSISRSLRSYSLDFINSIFLVWYKSDSILNFNNVFIPNNLASDYYVNLARDYWSSSHGAYVKQFYVDLYGYDYLYYNSSNRWYSLAEKLLSPSPTDYSYTLRYYFNDILDNSLTETLTYSGYENDVVFITPDSILNGYTLYGDNYQFVAGGNNIINIYYRNEMYHKQYYTINVYLDNIYYKKYSYTSFGEIDDVVDLDLDENIDNTYFLSNEEYSFTINEDVNLNEFSVNYYSEYYGTDYQIIDLSDSSIYLFIKPNDIARLFPNLLYHFDQFEQFLIIIVINIFFVVFLLFIFILVYRLFQKVLSYFF